VISLNSPDEVSPAMFEKFSRPYEERLVKELAVEEIFTAIHICGDTTRIVDSLAGYDFCGFELDYKTWKMGSGKWGQCANLDRIHLCPIFAACHGACVS
jgi:uroporphyrinogen-III decarboxylase